MDPGYHTLRLSNAGGTDAAKSNPRFILRAESYNVKYAETKARKPLVPLAPRMLAREAEPKNSRSSVA